MFTRASRLQRALDLRDSALGIFKSAWKQLDEVTVKLNEHMIESSNIIDAKQKEIEAEKALIEANRIHIDNAVKTIVKIKNILGE